MEKAKWHSTNNTNEYEPEPAKKGGSRRMIPPDVIYKMARKSLDGGTAFCEVCGLRFGMGWIRLCYVKPFKTGHCCTFCKKKHGLQEARR